MYAIKDTLTSTVVLRSDLVKKRVVVNSDDSRDLYDPDGTVFGWDTHKGWYFDFPTKGERLLGEMVILGDYIAFSTTAISRDACEIPTFLYVMKTNGKGAIPRDNPYHPIDCPTCNPNDNAGKKSTGLPLFLKVGDTLGVAKTCNGKACFDKISKLLLPTPRAFWKEIIRK
jgi:hypothetical protein